MKLSTRIRTARTRAGMWQGALAEALGAFMAVLDGRTLRDLLGPTAPALRQRLGMEGDPEDSPEARAEVPA